MTAQISGFIDISHHNRQALGHPLDFAAVAAAGLTPVIMSRATYGDPQVFAPATLYFGEFMRAQAAAGFTCRGGYHNLIRGDAASIKRQVDFLRRELDTYSAEWAMADVEYYPELVANGLWPRFADVLRFQDIWYARDERVMSWYIPRWDWDGHLGRPDLRVLHGPLIGSAYEDNAHLPWRELYTHEVPDGVRAFDAYGGRTPEIGQIGSRVVVAGSDVNTDINIYRGPPEDLVALLTGGKMIWTDADRAVVREEVVNALNLAVPYQSAGVATWATAHGWGRLSTRAAVEIAWQHTVAELAPLPAAVAAIAAHAGLDPAELASVLAAAEQGAREGISESADDLINAIVARLNAPGTGELTIADVESALRDVLVHGAVVPEPTPQP